MDPNYYFASFMLASINIERYYFNGNNNFWLDICCWGMNNKMGIYGVLVIDNINQIDESKNYLPNTDIFHNENLKPAVEPVIAMINQISPNLFNETCKKNELLNSYKEILSTYKAIENEEENIFRDFCPFPKWRTFEESDSDSDSDSDEEKEEK